MSLQGLPSFLNPLQGTGFRIYWPYDNVGACALEPDSLELATLAGDTPDFAYDWIRRDDQSKALYSVLSFRVAPHFPVDAARAGLRAERPASTLRNAAFAGGFLRLVPIGESVALPSELTAPISLTWSGLGNAAFRLQLDGATADLVGGLLADKTLALLAYAEMELIGVSPQLPLGVTFDPAQLIHAIAPDPDKRVVSRDALYQRLLAHIDSFPFQWRGDRTSFSPALIADTLADFVRMRLGRFVPAPILDGSGRFSLPSGLSAGRHVWDLNEPLVARRVRVLTLKPFDTLYQLTRVRGIDSVIHKIEVPALNLGSMTIHVAADLPDGIEGALGVTLAAPPNPPLRPGAILPPPIALAPPDYRGQTTARFSPAETPHYTYATWCDLGDGGYFEAPARPSFGDPARLNLQPEDFPVDFIAITVSDRLNRLAVLSGRASFTAGGRKHERKIQAAAGAQKIVLTVPRGAADGELWLRATPRDAGRALELRLPLEAVALDVTSFAEYGAHELPVHCLFPSDERRALLLDFRGADSDDVNAVRLTHAQPTARFSWFATTPFEPRYRFRQHGEGDWSAPLAPFTPLALQYNAATGRVFRVEVHVA